MKLVFRFRRYLMVMLVIVSCGVILATCMENDQSGRKSDVAKGSQGNAIRNEFSAFTGSPACKDCHKDIYESHIITAHHLTSMPAGERNILGSFAPGRNRYQYTPALHITMEKSDSGFYQSVYYQGEKKKDFRFDITTGSGTKGQTYLYWVDNKLFQMPISYFTAPAQWSVSPGFPPDKVLFDKPITSRCLECHATFAQSIPVPGARQEEFDRRKILFGVECERCHGPGAEHVNFHNTDKSRAKGKYITDPSGFSRQQQLDMCVVCHGGSLTKTQPSFSFQSGDKLDDFFKMDTVAISAVKTGNADVHGNQYGLLRASKCFRLSETMTCITCHDPHAKERGKTMLYSTRCMTCHKTEHDNFCTITPRPPGIEKNCIDCHMPKQPSMAVTLFTEGSEVPTPAMIRTHFINIYPGETKKFIPLMQE